MNKRSRMTAMFVCSFIQRAIITITNLDEIPSRHLVQSKKLKQMKKRREQNYLCISACLFGEAVHLCGFVRARLI